MSAQPTPIASLKAPTPSPSSTPDDPATTWQRLAHVVDEGQVRRVISESGSVWAVGFTGQTSTGLGGVPVVWRSDAAELWTRVELPIPQSAALEPQVLVDVEHLAADDGRVFAFGSISALDSSRSVAWQSSDGGQTWTEANAPPPDRVKDATGGPAGLVVLGSGGGSFGARVYASSGAEPTWADLSPFAVDAGSASAVVGTSVGYVLAGALGGPGGQPRPRIWRSPDGRSWEAADIEGATEQGSVIAVTTDGSGRWVALGLLDSEATTWTSLDAGRSWQVASTGDLPADGLVHAQLQLAGLAAGFAIVHVGGSAWFSDDGVAWEAVDPWPSPARGESALGLARVGERVVLVHNDAPFTTGASAEEGWTVWGAWESR